MSGTRRFMAGTLIFVGGFLGGSVRTFLDPTPAYAGPPKSVSAEEFRLVGSNGKTAAQMVLSKEGSPAIFFFDKDGKARLQVGLYGDGLPFVGLFDTKGQATALLRNAGSQESPVVVLKAGGRDRMIVGLELDKAGQEPFISYWNEKGEKQELIVPKK